MNSTKEVTGEQVVREWVEHDLDDHYEPGAEFTITMPPTGLIERVDDLLRQREQEVRAEERERVVTILEGWVSIAEWERLSMDQLAAAIRRDDTPQEGEQPK